MMRTDGVSIIIPTYNRHTLVGFTIESLLKQRLPADELIVIDDGSTDDTPLLAAQYSGVITYARKENGGKSSALNHGLTIAQGRLIWIFDDDDIAYPWALESLREALESANSDFSYGNFSQFEVAQDGRPPRLEHIIGAESNERDLFVGALHRCFAFQPGMLVKARCYDELGAFDERLIRSQDYQMLLRLAGRFKGAKSNRLIFAQRVHRGARGTKSQPISANAIAANADVFDRLIFGELYNETPLSMYIKAETSPNQDDGILLRSRLYFRALVMARRCLWAKVALDLENLALLPRPIPPARLDPHVLTICIRICDSQSRLLVEGEEATAFLCQMVAQADQSDRKLLACALMLGVMVGIVESVRKRNSHRLDTCLGLLRQLAPVCGLNVRTWASCLTIIFRECLDIARRRLGGTTCVQRSATRYLRRHVLVNRFP